MIHKFANSCLMPSAYREFLRSPRQPDRQPRTRDMARAGAYSNEARRCRRLPDEQGDTNIQSRQQPNTWAVPQLVAPNRTPFIILCLSPGPSSVPCRGPVLVPSPGDEVLSERGVAGQRWQLKCRMSFLPSHSNRIPKDYRSMESS